MKPLPNEIFVDSEHIDDYSCGSKCPIAQALIKQGYPMDIYKYYIGGFGMVSFNEKAIGTYKWKHTGEEFSHHSLEKYKEGILTLCI